MTSPQPWTARRVLAWASDDFSSREFDSPRLDAELLLCDALQIDRVRLYMDLERPLTPDERGLFRERVQRRRRGEPVAYILGKKEFWGRSFKVDEHVLIPRPATERLIELALEVEAASVLDVGTGSGILGITYALEKADAAVVLLDISEDAIAVAAENAAALGVAERIELRQGDLFEPLREGELFDLIVSNPPYIREDDHEHLAADVRQFEPALALFGGADGFALHRRLVDGLHERLRPGGRALIEVGFDQARELAALFEASGRYAGCEIHEDLEKIERVVEVRGR